MVKNSIMALIIFLLISLGVIAIIKYPKQKKQTEAQNFVFEIGVYSFFDMENFSENTQEIQSFMNNNAFISLEQDLLKVSQISIKEKLSSSTKIDLNNKATSTNP